MAYDQNSAYEPPRRHYYEPTPPSNPARNEYQDYNGYAQHGNGQYEHYDQGYNNQGYPQQNGGYQDYGYDQAVNGGQDPHYGDAYQGGRAQQDNRQYHQENNSRSYDPRYQPRAQRGPPQQHPGPHPGQRGQPPPARAPYQGDPRGPPLPKQNGYPPQQQRPRDPYAQQNGDYANLPRMNGSGHPPQQSQAPMQPPPQDPSKMSMDEWKAKEKARFKKAALSPETLPLDNAFPSFPKKKEAPGTSSQRGSVEQARPSTSRSQHSQRPGASREHSYQTEGDVQQPPRRPEMDRQYSSPEFANPRQGGQQPNGYGRPDQRGAYTAATTPVREQYPEQWPMVQGQTPPKVEPQRRSPPQANGYAQYPPPNQRAPPQQQSYDANGPYEPRQMPKQRGPPPIDTRQPQQRPIHSGQPMSPAYLPPRPSTSQGPRQPPNQNYASPVEHYAGSTIPQESTRSLPNQMAGQPSMEDQYSRNGSLGDIYDDYNTTPPRQIKRAPTNREEEIEAEMPDFDAAAPQQTSQLHKRNQTMDKHLAESSHQPAQPPPLPRTATAPPEAMQQSGSAPDLRYNQQQYGPRQGPGPRGPPQRGMTGPYDQSQPPPGAHRQYDIPYRNQPPPQDRSYPQGRPLPSPNAPFATEPQVRRSLDDGRGPPNRQGPSQQQRFYQNGQPPRGGYPPQQRPDFDRNQTSQTVWSDPGQERVGSAPPQQALPPPPATATGVPLSQQRSAPDQSSRNSNPDSLPHHPVPVRAGHVQQGQAQPSKPPPVRNYNGGSASSQSSAPHQRQPSMDHFAQPVTQTEIDRLRQTVDNPPHSPKQTLILVKKLVEASGVLANEGGRADPKTAAKNRERYINEAYKRLKKLVAGGYPDAQFYMADCHGQGTLGLEVDTKEAFKLYQAAAKAGHPQAAYRTAVCCEMGPEEGGGTSRDYAKAVQWYRRAAALGDGPAMYKLGVVLLKGLLGNPKNIAEAVTWLKRGAEKADKDNPHALHELAMIHETSNTNPEIRNKVVADDGYAKELYLQASQLGYKFSQFRLGQAYEYGSLGLPIDNRNSIAWYTKAAAQGEHQAELALSGWYLTGAGGILEHSDTEAYLWARKAASSEPPLAKAMFAMGYFTENGIGCPASMDEARKWYGRAASYKFPKAIERLEELRRNPAGKNSKAAPANGKLTRKDQKKDEENCVVM
ncbi:hypothetical protein PRZ48_001930 [Zasmidium cellare]|uniref:HCP-like protein n=1 Tax=Zasmidium cellare TaxID=395010 RepID=A0ABR0F3B6_ZASCE|nr:hypothetical protein PRZ48_001930 [Zasmidium cellare]